MSSFMLLSLWMVVYVSVWERIRVMAPSRRGNCTRFVAVFGALSVASWSKTIAPFPSRIAAGGNRHVYKLRHISRYAELREQKKEYIFRTCRIRAAVLGWFGPRERVAVVWFGVKIEKLMTHRFGRSLRVINQRQTDRQSGLQVMPVEWFANRSTDDPSMTVVAMVMMMSSRGECPNYWWVCYLNMVSSALKAVRGLVCLLILN